MANAGGVEISLEFTPSWVVALVCFVIVLISILVDRFLLCTGQLLQKHKKWPLVGALQKIKEELMLLGFISLLLAVFQTRIGKICISERLANSWLPYHPIEIEAELESSEDQDIHRSLESSDSEDDESDSE